MAKYCKLLGRRIEGQYRTGDIFPPATGNLATDSGKPAFLEEYFEQQGQVNSFRWEVPYHLVTHLEESVAPPANPCDALQRHPGEATSVEFMPRNTRLPFLRE